MLDQRRALDAGVRGILSEVSTASQIKRALMKVAAGGLWVEVATAEMLLDQMFLGDGLTFRDKEKIKLISPREHDIIELVCRGRRNKADCTGTIHIREHSVASYEFYFRKT